MTTPAEILSAVYQATGARPDEITSDVRTARVSIARFLAMLLYQEGHPWSSNQDAALAVGKIDPGTGRHGLMRARHLMQNDEQFKAAYAKAKRLIENR
jgi:chromosomal replication initiation ATPase DnaA